MLREVLEIRRRPKNFGRHITIKSVWNVIQTILFKVNLAIIYIINGVDLSRWNWLMDFDILQPLVRFIYLRAGYNVYSDIRFETYRQWCKDRGIPFGVYWYVYVGFPIGQQVDAFVKVIDEGGWVLPPMADFEYTNLNQDQTTAWIKSFMERLQARCNVKVGIYTSPGWWNAKVRRNSWAKLYHLWVAHWTMADVPILPYDWLVALFWQWSADRNNLGRVYGSISGDYDMDLDRYMLDLASWRLLIQQDEVPVVTNVRITATPCLRLRADSSTLSETLSCIPYNTVVEYTHKVTVGQDDWLQVSYNGKLGWIAAKYQGNVYVQYL